MSGAGRRFINAGYTEIKPLIKVEGKPIIQHVIERFSPEDDFIFICSQDHLQKTMLKQILNDIMPKGQIIPIEPHKLGPVYAVLKAKNHINIDQPSIVNYCDFSWRWDYEDFKKTVSHNDCDGSVISYKGFHPHLLGHNLYASMRDDGNGWMIEIREKFSFTEDKMKCFQSDGSYYFKNGLYLIKYFQKLIEDGPSIKGEYYVSLVYNKMKEGGLNIYIYEIPFFLQWGTPEDLEEYLYWSEYFMNYKKRIG